MGLFDLFGSKEEREKGALRKLQQKHTERYGPPENRQKAIEQLAALDTPAALGALCMRFTVRSDVGITDDDEKESVRGHLVAAGPKAVGPVKAYLEKQESGISWGLRVLTDLLPAAEVMATVTADTWAVVNGKAITRQASRPSPPALEKEQETSIRFKLDGTPAAPSQSDTEGDSAAEAETCRP